VISLSHVLQLLLHYKYELLFPLAVVEGPITTVLGGFLASSHHLNIYAVFLIVVLGDLIEDTFFYVLGRLGGVRLARTYGHYIGITEQRILNLEQHFVKHTGKTLIVGKITHGLGFTVLFSAGTAKVPYPKFMVYNLVSVMLKSLILVVVGYYFGYAYERIDAYLNYSTYILLVLAALLLVGYYFATKAARRLL
jgi:membrane protein DedA with SNARE-associated domain